MSRKGWKTPERKTCCKCGVEKPAAEFGWKDKKKGYLRSTCKECDRVRGKQYREANKERISAKKKEWYEANREKLSECHHAYYMKNKKKFREYSRKWRENNPERVLEQRAAFYEAHPNYQKEYNTKYYEEHKEEILAANKEKRRQNRRYKKLTREQQLEILDNNRGLVPHIAKRYKCHEYLYDDMIQAGFVGLWRGIKELDKYKPNKSSLSTWLGWYIMRELGDFSYKAANNSGLSGDMRYAMKRNGGYDDAESEEDRRLFSTATHLDAPLDPYDNNEATIAETIGCEDEYDDGLDEAVQKLLSVLDDKERDCVVRNFGIGCEPQMKKDIAKDYGVSSSTIGYWISAALEQLRDQPGTSSLLVYLP